ncbi:MAG: HAD-IB family hydrolase [Parachlamydiaceae bacterium]|nr:HAD-IB family hydrolase [Parachlamydiaceae bacterium]
METKNSNSVIAVFDFDHTLINCDSLIPALIYMNGFWKTSAEFFLIVPKAIQYFFGKTSRQEIKEEILSRTIKGLLIEEVKKKGKQFADNRLDRYLKPEALKQLQWHQSQGHRCLLISASLDFYLEPWAARHGFEKVICSRLEISPENKVTGKLLGLNCWGIEKKLRFLSYAGPKENYQLYMYGDSLGDMDLLEIADFPFYRTF